MTENNETGDTGRASSERTRLALIDAALRLFGEKGFAATSTREIAAAAGANIGSIAYHFGGKEALRDACATHIVEGIGEVAGPVLSAVPLPADRATAEMQLGMAVERMGGFLLASQEAAAYVQFILRELQQPTTALDIIIAGVIEPFHRRFCQMWGAATGEEPESEAVKIAVFAMIGQLIYFRIGREAVIRRMGWETIGPEEARKVAATAFYNMKAAIAARRKDGAP